MKQMIKYIVLLCVVLSGCGYSFVHNAEYKGKTLAIPIFDNLSLRRTHEFELTEKFKIYFMNHSDFTIVNSGNSDYTLKGIIVKYETPALVEGVNDEVVQSSVRIKFKMELINNQTNKTEISSETSRYAEFVGTRGENESYARASVFEQLAEWAVFTICDKW